MKSQKINKEKIEKKIILEQALEIIENENIKKLSMRNIAAKCNFSATKLYYYYECKDHIIISLIEEGFKTINNRIKQKLSDKNSPKDNFINAINETYLFSNEKKHHFNIMFGINTQKFLDKDEIIPSTFINSHAEILKDNEEEFYQIICNLVKNYVNKDKEFTFSILSLFLGSFLLKSKKTIEKLHSYNENNFKITMQYIILLCEQQ
ncbi:MAG: TetR/AcrR family transcriptional regulator [Bacilli bacterium]